MAETSHWGKAFESLGIAAEEAAEGVRKFLEEWKNKNKSENQEDK